MDSDYNEIKYKKQNLLVSGYLKAKKETPPSSRDAIQHPLLRTGEIRIANLPNLDAALFEKA